MSSLNQLELLWQKDHAPFFLPISEGWTRIDSFSMYTRSNARSPPDALVIVGNGLQIQCGTVRLPLMYSSVKDLQKICQVLRNSSPNSFRLELLPQRIGDYYNLHLHVNNSELRRWAAEQRTIPKEMKNNFAEWCMRKPLSLMDSDIISAGDACAAQNFPWESRLLLPPFDYQRANVSWCLSLEKRVESKLTNFSFCLVSKLLHFQDSEKTDVWACPLTKILYDNESLEKNSCYYRELSLKGGVICDQMGLGKTYSCVLLALANPPRLHIRRRDGRDGRDGRREVPVASRLPASRATLIFCPNRLCHQWLEEIGKYLGPGAKERCRLFATKPHLNSADIKDLCRADFVVVSTSLLCNPCYCPGESFTFSDIFWHRVIVDEGHEFLKSDLRRKQELSLFHRILSTKSRYRWLCSGTPLANGAAGLDGIVTFLSGSTTVQALSDNLQPEGRDMLFAGYFRRNTKDSVKHLRLPAVVERTKFLELSSTERSIYQNAEGDQQRQLQLCTNVLVSSQDSDILGNVLLSMKNINEVMSRHFGMLAAQTAIKIQQAGSRREQVEKDGADEIARLEAAITTSWGANKEALREERKRAKQSCREKVKRLDELLEELRGEKKHQETQVELFRALNIESGAGCPCCFEPMKKVVVTSCAHVFCSDCAELMFTGRSVAACPHCRQPVPLGTFRVTSSTIGPRHDAQGSNDPAQAQLVDMCSRWGTKIANVVTEATRVIGENPAARVIVFSQWNRMLQLISQVLTDLRVKHVFCRGNVQVIMCSMRKFKTDPDVRIILLSSESCASGSNLTEATHVFLVDTVGTDPVRSRAIEDQAIARARRLGQKATVEVTRFVIKDSIEERLFQQAQALAKP
ncbi:MAG: SNF2-related protein [Sulfobacillus sp.]